VSRRGDGTLWIIDGQHRVELLVPALQRVYQGAGMASEAEGALALRRALQTIQGAWGRQAGNYSGHVIEALGLIYLRYGAAIDQPKVIAQLAKLTGGALKLIQQGKGLREQFGGTIPYSIADAIVVAYNRSSRGKAKLERWRG